MTTQEKTAVIKKIIENRKDNRNAIGAAGVESGLIELVNEALNDAFRADLKEIFVLK